MSSYGRTNTLVIDLNTTQLLADGHDADWKTAGATIDWSLVDANPNGATFPDGAMIPAGVKFIRYGDVLAEVTTSGKYGPCRTTANDGRQSLEAGKCFVVNRTVREDEVASDHAAQLFDGGRIWEARLLVGGAGQLTLAAIKAAFPRLSYAR